MRDYFDTMNSLGARLTGLLASGLGLDPLFFEGCFTEPMSALRLLHYSSEVRCRFRLGFALLLGVFVQRGGGRGCENVSFANLT